MDEREVDEKKNGNKEKGVGKNGKKRGTIKVYTKRREQDKER